METDDWTMIIKSHALIESLVTELIVSRIDEPKMRGLVERLPLGDKQIGKVRIAKDYDLLSKAERAFIARLSQLRNDLVHKFGNVDFDLSVYVSNLDQHQRLSWQKTFTWFEHGRQVNERWAKAATETPKTTVWFAVFLFVCMTTIKISEHQTTTKLRDEADKTTRKLVKEII
jgi:hypothetical protein